MNLLDRIREHGLTLSDIARLGDVDGRNPARTVQRWLTGERQAPTEFVDRINRKMPWISANDFHAQRMEWIRNRQKG